MDKLVGDGAVIGIEATLWQDGASNQLTAGLGDVETESAYPRHASFRIGSVTKSFTAAMVLQLAEEGKVDLDKSIETYLPGLLHGKGIEPDKISVRQILRHQSGLPEMEGEPEATQVFTPEELIDLALQNPAQFPAGEKMVYTNTNFIVAGMLIERVDGRPYAEALSERITGPLGLDDTFLPEIGDTLPPEPHPTGYDLSSGKPVDVTEREASQFWTAGGLVSTGADLDRFFLALANGELVPTAQLDQMHDRVPMGNMPDLGYGLGLIRFPLSCDVTAWGHAGDVPGFQTMSAATEDGSRAVAIALNQSPTKDFGPPQLLELLNTALC